jgi:acyl transferase domain-containing protein
MGIELLRFPQFHRSILEASDYLKKLGCSWDLREELEKPAAKSRINEPEYSQPICTAFQIALLALLDLTGIKPVAVLGHSSGEIAAAYCKGAISRESALKIAYFRGLIAKELTHMPSYDGTMIAVGLSEQDARPVLWQLAEAGHTDLHIACINSPSNVTISGSTRCIDAMQKLLHKSGTFARVLKVNIAYHSPHMNSVAARYRGLLEGIVPSDHIITSPIMCSSVTGEMVDGEELLQPDYWVSNLVSPVRFTDSLAQVGKFFKKEQVKKLDLSHRGKASITNIVEIGPHGALKAPIRDTLRQYTDQEIDHQSLITRNNSAIDTFLSAIGNLSCSGIEVSLDSINNTDGVKALQALVDLPCYPFNHSRSYWQESQQSKGLRLRRQKRLELLGAPVPNWNPLSATWRNFLDQSKSPWLKDHKVGS